MQRVVLRDASGHEITSVFYGESTGHHNSEGIADDGIVTDIERREGVERLMRHITSRDHRISGPFRWDWPDIGRRSYVGLQPNMLGDTSAPPFIEEDQTYDLAGATITFEEDVERPRGYFELTGTNTETAAREDVTLHWRDGTVTLEEGALLAVVHDDSGPTFSAHLEAAENAATSFLSGAEDTFASAWDSVTSWLV